MELRSSSLNASKKLAGSKGFSNLDNDCGNPEKTEPASEMLDDGREATTDVSRVVNGTQVRLVNDKHVPVPPGEVGELVLRGPNVTIAYWAGPGLIEDAPKDGLTSSAQGVNLNEIRAHAAEQLADYKVPESLKIVREIPRNALGKIDRKRLSNRASSNVYNNFLQAAGRLVRAASSFPSSFQAGGLESVRKTSSLTKNRPLKQCLHQVIHKMSKRI